MPTTPAAINQLCRVLIGLDDAGRDLTLAQYLAAIPKLDSLANLPAGTPVLVRGDVDAKPGDAVGKGDIRLQSMVETLNFGRERGWKQIVFGHIGREPEGSLHKVAKRLGELLDCNVLLVDDWFDEATLTITPAAVEAVKNAPNGAVLVLQNTRKYAIERALWKAKEADLEALAPKLAQVANEFAEKLGTAYVNEALSAGSLDVSTTIIPAAMDRVALGNYVASEFAGPMMRCLAAKMVIFSGLKADKLDDLDAMIDRGQVETILCAGSLAMALKKAAAQIEGKDFPLGVAEDPAHADKPYFVPADRIAQARRMIERGRAKGIEFILPVDFILQDGRAAETLGPGDQQFDVGPKSSEHFAQKVGEFIAQAKGANEPTAVFYNGVFGMFEDSRFEAGTRRFIPELKRMKDAGLEVYIGGGEGGKALEKYGQPNWVTHCFTAGGTVLNALGSEPVPYLVALSGKWK